MSVSQKELETTPIFAELTAEFDLEQLLGESEQQAGAGEEAVAAE